MHTRIFNKAALAITLWIALHTSALHAQIFTAPLQASTTGTNPVDFEFRADGTMIAKGNYGVGNLLSTDEGAGTRMLWFPHLSAFRAGTVDSGGTEWDQSNIGQYSTAFGLDTIAAGTHSTAFGLSTNASGEGATAFGYDTEASGTFSTAMGSTSSASGIIGFAAGQLTTASGSFSTALGSYSTASGAGSLAFGYQTLATGNYATTLGQYSEAAGSQSVSIGFLTQALGNSSTAMGARTIANSYNSFVIGIYNIGGGTTSSWVSTDPLFEIGNGGNGTYGNPDTTSPSDAFVVYKNGDAILQGSLQVAPGGDIPMYTGN